MKKMIEFSRKFVEPSETAFFLVICSHEHSKWIKKHVRRAGLIRKLACEHLIWRHLILISTSGQSVDNIDSSVEGLTPTFWWKTKFKEQKKSKLTYVSIFFINYTILRLCTRDRELLLYPMSQTELSKWLRITSIVTPKILYSFIVVHHWKIMEWLKDFQSIHPLFASRKIWNWIKGWVPIEVSVFKGRVMGGESWVAVAFLFKSRRSSGLADVVPVFRWESRRHHLQSVKKKWRYTKKYKWGCGGR